MDRDELINEILRVADLNHVSGSPSAQDMNNYGRISVTPYYNEFDSWLEAKKLAGFTYSTSSERETRECSVCGEEHRVLKSEYKLQNGDWTCSDKCKENYYWKTVTCDNCETEIKRRKCNIEYGLRNSTYCSKECFDDAQSNGKYRERELQMWAEKVKEEYKYTCAECGESHDTMTAHHDPPRERLSIDEQTDVENGICLCYPCHAEKHNGPQRKALLGWWEWYSGGKN